MLHEVYSSLLLHTDNVIEPRHYKGTQWHTVLGLYPVFLSADMACSVYLEQNLMFSLNRGVISIID